MPSGRDNLNLDSIEWNGMTIGFSYCHSRRRTLGITVRPDRSVAVRVPLRTSLKDIRSFVTHRAAWVAKAWERMEARQPVLQQEYQHGAPFLLQGQTYRLEVRLGERENVELRDSDLLLSTPTPPTEGSIRRLIKGWYRNRALETVRERSIHCHRLMQAENIPLPDITIRSMKSRWGSYSYRTGRITLNLNLIKTPQECLDYVLIHELCHIRLRHHGPDFWAMVERYIPDYRKVRAELRRYIEL